MFDSAADADWYERICLAKLADVERTGVDVAPWRAALDQAVASGLGAGQPLAVVTRRALTGTYVAYAPPWSAFFCGRAVPFGRYDVIDYLASSCDTVADALARICRYFALVYASAELRFVAAGSGPPALEIWHPSGEHDAFFDEYFLGVTLGRFEALAEGPVRATVVRFARAAPATAVTARLEDVFGCRVGFGAPATHLQLTRETLALRLRQRNVRLREALEEHAREALAQQVEDGAEDDLVRHVRAVIATAIAHGEPRIEGVAQRLALTPRTLQRRLRERDLGFASLVDEARRGLADRHLRDFQLSVTEVAFLLGYSEVSAFVRAFRRWTGVTPQRWRAERAADRGAAGATSLARQ